jgi:replicative DNA helicase
MNLLDRKLPFDLDAEEHLIAGCLVDPSNIDRIVIRQDQFFDAGLGEAWNLLQDMRACSDPIDDMVAISSRMKARGIWETIGGSAWVRKMFEQGSVHKWHCEFYAKQIATMAQYRKLIEIGTDVIRDGYECSKDPCSIASKAQASLSARLEIRDDVHRIGELTDEMFAKLDDTKQDRRRVFTGFQKFDLDYGPMMSGEMVVVAAKTSIGKTAIMVQMGLYHADMDRPVLFCSLEMPMEQLRDRIFCGIAGIPSNEFRSGRLSREHRTKLERAAASFRDKPFYIWSPRGDKSITRIAAKARSVQAEFKIQCLFVDYLQKIQHYDKSGSREEHVAACSRGVKDIALDLDVPVVVGCQLNRKADEDGEPELHMLRESGSIEQDADMVMFVHRKTRLTLEGKLIVAKHRCGTTGSIGLGFDPLHQVFSLEPPTRTGDDEDGQRRFL